MWDSIKTILKNKTDKCLIIEDGEPKYVILPYEEYQQLSKDQDHSIVDEDRAELDEGKINDKIQEEVEIEDLPF